MLDHHRTLIACLKHMIAWCVIALIATWLYMLHIQSYGAFAMMGIFIVGTIFGVFNQFVLRQITAERISIIPDLTWDVR